MAPTTEQQRDAWLRIALAEAEGTPCLARAVRAFGSPVALLSATPTALAPHLRRASAHAVLARLRSLRPAALLRQACDLGQDVLTPCEAAWPAEALQALTDPPAALFVQGRLPAQGRPAVALVGTRDASPYGRGVATALAGELARRGAWVVSGFAVGVDGAAHRGALEGGGPTLAVLGCGIDQPYPLAHEDLKPAVARDGGLASEHPPGTPPRKHHFPRRNRLVAALAHAVVVIEAGERSGALITARLALDQGREVLAVPGSIHSSGSLGPHRLLRQGAALCAGVGDILRVLGLEGPAGAVVSAGPQDGVSALLWRALDDCDPVDVGVLCDRTGLPVAEVTATLVGLELDGHARRLPGLGFVRRR